MAWSEQCGGALGGIPITGRPAITAEPSIILAIIGMDNLLRLLAGETGRWI